MAMQVMATRPAPTNKEIKGALAPGERLAPSILVWISPISNHSAEFGPINRAGRFADDGLVAFPRVPAM
jgi:hypothetical protein